MAKNKTQTNQQAPDQPVSQEFPSLKSRINWLNGTPDLGEQFERFIQLGDSFDKNWLQKPALIAEHKPVQQAYRDMALMLIGIARALESGYAAYEYNTAMLSQYIRHLERPLFTEGAFQELSRLWVMLRADIPDPDNLVLRKNGNAQANGRAAWENKLHKPSHVSIRNPPKENKISLMFGGNIPQIDFSTDTLQGKLIMLIQHKKGKILMKDCKDIYPDMTTIKGVKAACKNCYNLVNDIRQKLKKNCIDPNILTNFNLKDHNQPAQFTVPLR